MSDAARRAPHEWQQPRWRTLPRMQQQASACSRSTVCRRGPGELHASERCAQRPWHGCRCSTSSCCPRNTCMLYAPLPPVPACSAWQCLACMTGAHTAKVNVHVHVHAGDRGAGVAAAAASRAAHARRPGSATAPTPGTTVGCRMAWPEGSAACRWARAAATVGRGAGPQERLRWQQRRSQGRLEAPVHGSCISLACEKPSRNRSCAYAPTSMQASCMACNELDTAVTIVVSCCR